MPQLGAVRAFPQLSVPVTMPQFFPSRAQKVASFSTEQPQVLALPSPPHDGGAVQVPQLTERSWLQRSGPVTVPQLAWFLAQNCVFVSLGQLQTPALQLFGPVHVPQLDTVRITPQLSAAVTAPHDRLLRAQNCVLVSGAQPHRPCRPPPPHVWLPEQVPQLTVRCCPQTSVAI